MNTSVTLHPGSPTPLGATVRDGGVNFALYSAQAERVELCIFNNDGTQEIQRFEMPEVTNHVWHCWVEGLKAGTVYGYRVYGPFEPKHGQRFNPNKLALDPYAKKLLSPFKWHESLYGYPFDDPAQDLVLDTVDSGPFAPKAVVVECRNPVKPLEPPVPWTDTVVYELHVKGFTKLHEGVPSELRGSYLGLAHDSVLTYLKDLGVTSVELLPVHAFADEHFLIKRDLVNYWGYNTLNFFTPHLAYTSNGNSDEFKTMVERFHEAGIEVLLDVVYNHTAEGNHLGAHLCYRAIDNATYYTLHNNSPRFYVNDTGCGNTLNVKHPRVMQMVLDSLRHWVTYYGVDGFRFDLATVMGREALGFDPGAGFFDAIAQDPVLSKVKLIAEPWDIGPGGYQVGRFPAGWSEWNDRYRDTIRRFWRGDEGQLPEFARRIHGSSDMFEHSGRHPWASVNFVTSHDGFTLRDMVSYNQRHNHANKEQNNDGHHTNFSYNYGVEGPTKNERIDALRFRQQRNVLATLILSQGTPMILAGDEMGRTQNGNNNAYCQDNPITWLDWKHLHEEHLGLRDFVRNVLKVRRDFPLLRSRSYIHKPDPDKKPGYNIHWLNKDGKPMEESEWQSSQCFTLGWMLESVVDRQCVHCLLTLFNSGNETVAFSLPEDWHWTVLIDTNTNNGLPGATDMELGSTINVEFKSMLILYGISNQCQWETRAPLLGD